VKSTTWRSWVLVLSGPSLWFGAFVASYVITTQGCTPMQRQWLVALNGGALGLCLVLGGLALWQQRGSVPGHIRFLLRSSIGLQAFCALLAFGQLLPVLMQVSCD